MQSPLAPMLTVTIISYRIRFSWRITFRLPGSLARRVIVRGGRIAKRVLARL